jgi:hypothetical protein
MIRRVARIHAGLLVARSGARINRRPPTTEQRQHAAVDDMLAAGVINPDAAERMKVEITARWR